MKLDIPFKMMYHMLRSKEYCLRCYGFAEDQRGSVKKGNMGIGKSFFKIKSMRVIWAILSHLKMTHITLINLKRENYGTSQTIYSSQPHH